MSRSGENLVERRTKPSSSAITLVQSPAGSTHACEANQ
jgi:hypothetical protein